MDLFTIAVLFLAAAATAAVAVEGRRRPILWRMALRNALRRPKQTATVVAGLMVGTAIISSALVAGDSARGAIRSYVYQSLGDVDESVALQGYPYFPQAVYARLANDAAVRQGFDAYSAHAIWQGAGEAPDSGLFEPNLALVGFEPGRDAGFGTYHSPSGGATDGRDLQPGQAIATAHLASLLDLQPGDRVTVSYALPVDPILPRIFAFNGTATGADIPLPMPGLPPGAAAPVYDVPVEPGATFLAVALFWDPAPGQGLPPVTSLAARLTAPNGTVYATPFSQPAAAQAPVFLNVTVPADQTLVQGEWRLKVQAQAAANVRFVAVAVVGYPVYDPALLQERAEALRAASGPLRERVPGLNEYSKRHTTNFTVVAVTDGGRGDLFDFRDALFIRLDEAQALFHREGQVNLVKFSNPGDEVTGETGTDAAMATLNRTLAALKASYPELPSVQNLVAKPLKREFLAQADAKGQTLTGLLVFAGSLSIITGLLLILNIFTMLAEERRSELGMARAVGLTRSDLVRLSVFEGSLYAVAAAGIGALLGLGLAYAMIAVMNAIVSHLRRDLSFPAIEFSPSWGAFLVALSLGALLTFVTIVFASRRQS
ncbi:MAG: FtsX-like permease family protein, partial [Thermoplasmatota archaeon]